MVKYVDIIKNNKMKKVIDFYNETTAEEKCYLLMLMSKDIIVPIEKEDGVHIMDLDDEMPVSMNGTAFQINTEDLCVKEKLRFNNN